MMSCVDPLLDLKNVGHQKKVVGRIGLCFYYNIFPISTYIGCNRLVYIPDHMLLCVLISTPIVAIDRLRPRPIPTSTYSESLSILSLPLKYQS